ncbi:putative membrane protein [Actinoplanes lutulentus]|uniref:Putative membrane protein n=1 Tax=Actinoplanes lutulentus TaxID=1287878 RepID=A0A327ZAX7_9ACTN|nr:DUF2231 domain-containing protein [Actinoplanes lutulentus]MBB2941270.1 putative membrane protein [Actinoplanes lutulentus]RAK36762.1 putative membrane protein [Actinoplanes lutulentus]
MQSRLRLGGHAVQPLLLMFPLGLFAMALIFDLASLLGGPKLFGTLAFWNIVAGLAGGLFAALAGGFEAFTARNPDAARVAFLSLLLDGSVLILFAVLTLTRVRGQDRLADPGLLVVEVAGLALAVFGAWFGGRFTESNRPPRMRRTAFRSADDAAGTRSRTV